MLVAMVGGCTSDRAGRLPTDGGERELSISGCENWCVIAQGERPFLAARIREDSTAFDVTLAMFRVTALPGGSAVLALEAPQEWWSAVPVAASVFIEIGGVRRQVPLHDLSEGLEIARFNEAADVRLRVDLPRQFDDLPAGPVLFRLRTSALEIVESHLPWGELPDISPSLTGTCGFNAPGSWCGVVVGIDPFFQGTAWTPTGFQSAEGTGVSSTIHITFDKDVDNFSVSVYDPDSPTNRVIAYNAAGGVIANVVVPGDGTPGTLTIIPITITATGIRSVDLVPGAGDYVAYDNASFETELQITVQCNPSPVQRGSQVTCTASAPAGVNLTVSQWQFVGPELTGPIASASTSLQWAGTAATGGTVTVTGTLNGDAATGEGAMTVSNRNWLQDTVAFRVEETTPANLPVHPESTSHLGNHAGFVDVFSQSGGFEQITSGPNAGVIYFTKVPVHGLSRININRVALSVGSDFYNRQPNNGPPSKCKKPDVVPFIPLAEAHEGLTLSPTSHAGVLRHELNARVPQPTEAAVALNSASLAEENAQVLAQPGIDVAKSLSRDSSQGGTVPPIPYCMFKFF